MHEQSKGLNILIIFSSTPDDSHHLPANIRIAPVRSNAEVKRRLDGLDLAL